MSKVLTVAWREFKQTVMRKVFFLAMIAMPIFIVGALGVAVLIMVQHEEPPLVGTVVIVEDSGEVATAAQVEFDQEKIRSDAQRELAKTTEQATDMMMGGTSGLQAASAMREMRGDVHITIESRESAAPEELDALRARVRDEKLLAVAVIPPSLLELPAPEQADGESEPDRFQLFVGERVDSDNVGLIERRVGQSIIRARAARAGHEPEQIMAMLKRPRSKTTRTLHSGEDAEESEGLREMRQMLVPMVFMLLIWAGTITAGQHLLMSTIEEKSNRVMEVLLSALSPLQLMTGKILGHGAVGLLIVLLYAGLGVGALIVFALFTQFVNPMDLVYLGVFYFMAYFMIAAIMAAIGSAVTDIREANTLMTPVMLVMIIPWMLWMPIIQAPNGAIATAFSFIPPATPFAMILRLAAEEPVPLWQIPASIIWGYACVIGMVWMAAKIFRVGVLMYGKPPSPLELVKWLRYS